MGHINIKRKAFHGLHVQEVLKKALGAYVHCFFLVRFGSLGAD